MNYENFSILPELREAVPKSLPTLPRFDLSTTRYTTSGFFRVKLANALNRRRVAPHIYDTRNEARGI